MLEVVISVASTVTELWRIVDRKVEISHQQLTDIEISSLFEIRQILADDSLISVERLLRYLPGLIIKFITVSLRWTSCW